MESSDSSGSPNEGIDAEKYPVDVVLFVRNSFSEFRFHNRNKSSEFVYHTKHPTERIFLNGLGKYFRSVELKKYYRKVELKRHPGKVEFTTYPGDIDLMETYLTITNSNPKLILTPVVMEQEFSILHSGSAWRLWKLKYGLRIETSDGRRLADINDYGIYREKIGILRLGSNLGHANKFTKAGEAAFEKLMQRLKTSKEFTAYVDAEIERQARPAQLLAEVRFDDSRALFPNGRLDAGETGDLVVTVRNQGAGAGYEVTLGVSTLLPEVTVSDVQTALGRIPPGESREARLPVSAGLALPTGETSLVVRAAEKRGYDARTVEFVLPTVRLEKPSISIVTHEINDGTTGSARGNGNGIPENGETVELLVFVRNDGPGPTAGATLSAAAAESDVEVIRGESALGVIEPHGVAQGVIALSIPRTWDRSRLELDLQVRRRARKGGWRKPRPAGGSGGIPASARSRRIDPHVARWPGNPGADE